jgi:hypothetical protein
MFPSFFRRSPCCRSPALSPFYAATTKVRIVAPQPHTPHLTGPSCNLFFKSSASKFIRFHRRRSCRALTDTIKKLSTTNNGYTTLRQLRQLRWTCLCGKLSGQDANVAVRSRNHGTTGCCRCKHGRKVAVPELRIARLQKLIIRRLNGHHLESSSIASPIMRHEIVRFGSFSDPPDMTALAGPTPNSYSALVGIDRKFNRSLMTDVCRLA